MWNSLIGDYIGSHYEGQDIKGRELPLICKDSRLTDDSVLLVATANSIVNKIPFAESYRYWANKYPDAGYGNGFTEWLSKNGPGYSFGNGASVRSSIIGLLPYSKSDILDKAKESATCSHGHPEGVNGAQASALAVHLAKVGAEFDQVFSEMYERFDYLLAYDLDDLHLNYGFDTSAENTVPIAIFIAFKSESMIEAIKNCLYVGGDVDTIMSMVCTIKGAMMQDHSESAIEGVMNAVVDIVSQDDEMKQIINSFNNMLG